MTNRKDVCLITWTCSHLKQIDFYLQEMKKDDIVFDYINENPEVVTDQMYGCYDKKPYYNIVIDDKGGVTPEELELIYKAFKRQKEL